MKMSKCVPYVLAVTVCGLVATTVAARQTTLSGGLSTGYEYFDRTYDKSSEELAAEGIPVRRNDEDYSRVFLTPTIKIVSASEKRGLRTFPPVGIKISSWNSSRRFNAASIRRRIALLGLPSAKTAAPMIIANVFPIISICIL